MLNTKRNLKKQNKNTSKYYLVNTYILYHKWVQQA